MTLIPDESINVSVETQYIKEQSKPDSDFYVFSYTITITNNGLETAQLMTRHWVITDSNSKSQEVRGDGVVGEQPVLKPGESFVYTSGTMIETPVGTMHGSYGMMGENGNSFDAPIDEFILATPRVLH